MSRLIFMLGTVLSAIATTVEFLVLKREARHAAGLADVTDFSFNIIRVSFNMLKSSCRILIISNRWPRACRDRISPRW